MCEMDVLAVRYKFNARSTACVLFSLFSISSQIIVSFLTYAQDFVIALAFVSLLISFFLSLLLFFSSARFRSDRSPPR